MCAIGSYIITFGGYLALGQLPINDSFAARLTYYLIVLGLTILTTIFMREEMANVQTVFIFDPKKAKREE